MLPVLSALFGAIVGGTVSIVGFSAGIGDIVTRRLNELFQAKMLTADVLITAYRRGILTKEQYLREMTKIGYNDERAMISLDSSVNGLNLGEIMTLYYRFNERQTKPDWMGELWLLRRLSESGYNPERKEEILEANRNVPTLQDTIVFAVRDVFEEEQVKAAGLLEGLPETFVREAQERGLSREDAAKYWAAHWQLPSLTSVYEMFHRFYPGSGHNSTFTEDDMDVFFNLADIAPGYRKRLKELSYNPLTRVDIRRMYTMGLYGEGEAARPGLIRDYRMLGYSPVDANRLASFTLLSYSSTKKKLTPSQILKFYTNQIWGEKSRETAREKLKEGGYSDELASGLLDYEDRRIITQEERRKIDSIREQWIAGTIASEAELHTSLMAIPLENAKAQALIKEFNAEKEKRVSRLSRNEYDDMYRDGVITESQYKRFLRNLGYPSEDIELIISYKGESRTNPSTLPTKEDILSWYSKDFITPVSFIRLMREIGYRDEFIVLYAQSENKELEDEIVRKLHIIQVNDETYLRT